MATTREEAARIRAALKAQGYSARDVGVRAEYFSLGSSITITVKNPNVPAALVRELDAVAVYCALGSYAHAA